MMALPTSVTDLVEFVPAEDFLLALLREKIPDIPVQSLIEANQDAPFILVRRTSDFDSYQGDARFVDDINVDINCVCKGVDGDREAALLSEAVRVVLRDAWLQGTVIEGMGHISSWQMFIAPHRVPDWATATGPVQYADLPTGFTRYESSHNIELRRALT